MKKVLSIVLAVALVFGASFVVSAGTDPTVTATPSKTEVKPGDEFTVTYAVANLPNVKSGNMPAVGFDTDRLEITKGVWSIPDEDTEGTEYAVKKNWASKNPTTAPIFAYEDEATINGTFFTYTFKVKDTATAGTASVTKFDEKVIEFQNGTTKYNPAVTPASVTVVVPSTELTVTATPSVTSAKAGDEFTVTYSVANLPNVKSGNMPAVGFDTERLEITKGVWSIPDEDNEGTEYAVKKNWASKNPTTAPIFAYEDEATIDGNFFTYTFKVKDTAASGAASVTKFDEKVIEFQNGTTKYNPAVTPASVTIIGEKQDLPGAITISGTAKYGQTLSVASDTVTAENVTKQWYRGDDAIVGATGTTYTLTKDDIGKNITYRAIAQSDCEYKGTVTSNAIGPVEKADTTAPAAPVAVAFDKANPGTTSPESNIKVTDAKTGYEYALVAKGATLQDSDFGTAALFTGLTRNTQYDVYARVAETETAKASPASVATTVTTDDHTPSVTWTPVDEDYHAHTCINVGCGNMIIDSTKEAHNYVEGVKNKITLKTPATATSYAVYYKVCDKCGRVSTVQTYEDVVGGYTLETVAVTNVAPVKYATPATTFGTVATDHFAGTISWTPADSTFTPNTQYTATFTVTALSGYHLVNGTTVFKVEGNVVTGTITGDTATFSYTFPPVGDKEQLPGEITITGTAKYGEKLTVSNDTVTAPNVTKQWYRGDSAIAGATDDNYTLTKEDIGMSITCRATATSECDYTGTVKSNAIGPVEKADGPSAPAAPTAVAFDKANPGTTSPESNIKVTDAKTGYEYALVAKGAIPQDSDWGTADLFTGLTRNTQYDVYARVAETETAKVSPASAATTVTTDDHTPSVTWTDIDEDNHAHTCINVGCGNTVIDSTKEAHDYVEGVKDNTTLKTAATCHTYAVYYKVCSKCGRISNSKTYEYAAGGYDATNHDGEQKTIGAKPAGCVDSGYTGDLTCMGCSTVLQKGSVIPAHGHSVAEWTVTKEPTTTETGLQTGTCIYCTEVQTVVIPKLSTDKFDAKNEEGSSFTPNEGTKVPGDVTFNVYHDEIPAEAQQIIAEILKGLEDKLKEAGSQITDKNFKAGGYSYLELVATRTNDKGEPIKTEDIKLNGPVKVTLKVPAGVSLTNAVLINALGDKKTEIVKFTDNGNGTITFETQNLGEFIFVNPVTTTQEETSPKTGDNNMVELFSLLMAIACGGCAVILGKKKFC